MAFYSVVLAGGGGTRLWPVSTRHAPKPFRSFLGPDRPTLFRMTIDRALRSAVPKALRVVCAPHLSPLVGFELEQLGFASSSVVIEEPEPRNTGPAVLLAALHLVSQDPQAVMAVLPADHLIRREADYDRAIALAARAAEDRRVVLLGLVPDRPETGFGYIESEPGAAPFQPVPVRRFVEKPDAQKARAFVESGHYFWNSGIFVFRADVVIEEFARFQPDMVRAMKAFLAGDTSAFARCVDLSFDYAVLEHSERVTVIPVDLGWSDVGNWWAVHEQFPLDESGNSARGSVVSRDSRNCHLHAETRPLVVLGMENAVVVESQAGVLVAGSQWMQEVREAVDDLPVATPSSEPDDAPVIEGEHCRPWGRFRILDQGPGFKTKRLDVLPGRRTSLQKHDYRAENWIVTSGLARVTRGDEVFELKTGETTHIPVGCIHRIENPGQEMLSLVEVQAGERLLESDVHRIADDYGRAPAECATSS
ncbi:mannose-1-phosphate guanylyltransferase/mannose-6-phosphate isomerase [Sulfidibacter corallicola]|uniref:mannose-1-phosphate guanylyltransferase n=1 Tax=Sulfidibacter corallicola TaxID=2818388 RepID=A0A8A4TV75_SULCO|nr:mannose-1-phosphate guanylyltransferase/mannose-6-phosphate isomerase [Sulfidibacter corallicola]QTD53856.1 mannose-1-phosphate guanylyltransferase/mannose-6-phosphate isomerase [Sulfidibacter corallicola]